jgi:hypothetical protein
MTARAKLGFIVLVPLVLALLAPSLASACGGFFCTTLPVDQSAERIIFTMDEGRITTYVQINYVGFPRTSPGCCRFRVSRSWRLATWRPSAIWTA